MDLEEVLLQEHSRRQADKLAAWSSNNNSLMPAPASRHGPATFSPALITIPASILLLAADLCESESEAAESL